MIEEYNEIYKKCKKYMEENSNFEPNITKNYISTSTKFPTIALQLSNFMNTDYCTNDKIEKYDEMYLTIDIYTKDKTIDNEKKSSQEINDELTNLIIKFFEIINMKITLCRLTPNADNNITRRTIQVQGLVSRFNKNIIRR